MIDERNSYQSDDDYTRWLYTGITRAKEKLIMIEDF
jgi:ATP-dependent exoDNAse (exonuclease V) beta subunit